MENHSAHEVDFGTGHKSLLIYSIGIVLCSILTLISFGAVLSKQFSQGWLIAIIFISAVAQLAVQVFCFLRLNTKTAQGLSNVLSLLFTMIILISIVIGSLWIMHNLAYFTS
jgi:cytochrome o ubiquinol oxidase operon protein cyoD